MSEPVDGQGVPCWIDLWTSDVEGSRKFYSELFDWEALEASEEFGGYWMFERHGVPVAGGMGDMGELKANDTWKFYWSTRDINETVSRIERLGATFFMPPMPVGDMGIQTVFSDATGAVLGAWQPLVFQGFTPVEEHGAPCWFELNARDFDAAVNFYCTVFDLGAKVMSDSDELRYTTLMARDVEVAGVLDASRRLGDGDESHWVVYWQVDDINHSVARVRELGGSIIDGPFDSPFGPVATAADPSGAVFKLRSSPPTERLTGRG